MSLRPFFTYAGGKWLAAPSRYPRPEYKTIVEPFAGSAGYALRYPHLRILLGELDPIVFGIWSYLIAVDRRTILSLPDLTPDQTVDDLHVCQEAKWLIGFWLNKGVSSPRKSPSAWMRSGIRPKSFWGRHVRERIADQLQYIRHWTIRNCSYDELPFNEVATWFIDPPYQHLPDYYAHGSSDIDYGSLAEWCRTRPGQVIVCEAQQADWLPFVQAGRTRTARKGTYSPEAVWIKGDVDAIHR